MFKLLMRRLRNRRSKSGQYVKNTYHKIFATQLVSLVLHSRGNRMDENFDWI